MNSKVIRPLIAVIVLAGGGTWYVLSAGKTGDASVLYGNVDIRQVDLAFAVEGTIAEVLVEEGDAVKTGDVLARLDDAPYRHALTQTEAVAGQAAAQLAKLEAGSRIEEIDAARSRLAEARARLAAADAVLARRQPLAKSDNVSKQALDDAARDATVAKAAVATRDAELALALDGFRAEDITGARAALASATAAVEQAKYRVARTTLTAPAAGTVLTRAREPGAVVGNGAVVLTLSHATPVWIRTYVAEPYLGRLKPGTTVTVTTDDPAGKTYRGQVGFVSPTAEFTPKAVETPELRTDLVYRVRVIVDNPDGGLRQGMPVTVTLAK
jgi:HlyD family secretion protein